MVFLVCHMLAWVTPASANGASHEPPAGPAAHTPSGTLTHPGPDPSFAAVADPGAIARERADLARLVQELDWLIDEARRIEARAASATRNNIWFHFTDLATDLGRIRGGIADHLAGRVRQPNEIVPIRGRYTRAHSRDARAAR